MNLRERIIEGIKRMIRKYDYGCVMIRLKTDPEDWKALQAMVDEKDVYFGEDGEGYGREMNPHVTVLYGIHADVPDADVEEYIKEIKDPEIELQDVSSFTNKGFDVLKFDIHSKDLEALNKLFTKLPHTTEYPDYHPHATICYLKSGLAEKYVKKFKDIEPVDSKAKQIVYSKPDGVEKNYPILG